VIVRRSRQLARPYVQAIPRASARPRVQPRVSPRGGV